MCAAAVPQHHSTSSSCQCKVLTLLEVLDVAGGEGHADAVDLGALLLLANLGGSRLHRHLRESTRHRQKACPGSRQPSGRRQQHATCLLIKEDGNSVGNQRNEVQTACDRGEERSEGPQTLQEKGNFANAEHGQPRPRDGHLGKLFWILGSPRVSTFKAEGQVTEGALVVLQR